MQQPTLLDIVTLIGVILSFFVGAAGLWIGIRSSQKTTFINSITASRIDYIQNLRESIAEFCGLFYRYNILVEKNKEISTEKLEILKEVDRLKYLIFLYLNPEDKWDKKICELLNDIRESIDKNPTEKIKELITLTQYLLKLEWEGAKLESRKGIVPKKEKDKLYKKHFRLYENYLQKSSTK